MQKNIQEYEGQQNWGEKQANVSKENERFLRGKLAEYDSHVQELVQNHEGIVNKVQILLGHSGLLWEY